MLTARRTEPPFYDARRLIAEVFSAAFLPPAPVSVADWAATKRWLSNPGGGYIGRWRHDMAPYLREPMEALNNPGFRTIVVVGPGQCGKSEIAVNWLGASIEGDPADMLWYLQTDDARRSFVETRINPFINEHEALRARRGRNASDNSQSLKRFRSMAVEFLPATSSTMITRKAGRIVADEWDAYDENLGDVKALLDIRRQTFGSQSKLLAISHPDRAGGLAETRWKAGIMSLYRESDRRVGWWQCPECGAWSSPNPIAARHMALDWPAEAPLDEIAAAARLLCPVNGCVLDEAHRAQMRLTLRWVGRGQTIAEDGTIEGTLEPRDTAGFWIIGLMSGLIQGGMGALARAYVKAQRESLALGDDTTLRQVVVKQHGLPYDPPRRVGQLEATELADRAEAALVFGRVPEGVRFLTAAIDVQASRFEVLVRGWGERFESWVVDHQVHPCEPAVDPAAWDTLLGTLLGRGWPLDDGSGRVMPLRALGYDSQGAPGVTQQAYDAWKRFRAKRQALLRGAVDGRHAWNLLPLRGMPSPNAPVLSVVYPDTARKDRRASAGGQVPTGQFNANRFKDDLAGQLAKNGGGAWSVHVPAKLRSPEPPHAWFEQLVAEDRSAAGKWDNSRGGRNEALDLMVMTHVLARLHVAARMSWDRPPGWAAAWDKNTMIRAGGAVEQAVRLVQVLMPVTPAALPMPAAAQRPMARSLGMMLP